MSAYPSAYLNALHEEGTRTELFNELVRLYQKNIERETQLTAALNLAERHMNEKHKLRKALEELLEIDGSSANVASAEILATRVRAHVQKALKP